jgi:citrate synthase
MESLQTKPTLSQPAHVSRTLHAGLEGIVVAHTKLSDVRGQSGQLIIAGHRVETLAFSHNFEQAASLLLRTAGCAVTAADVASGMQRHRQSLISSGEKSSRPNEAMDALRADLAQLQASGHDLDDAYLVLAAAVLAISRWRSPDDAVAVDLAPIDAAMAALGVVANDAHRVALNAYLVTVMDHGMNASTFASRVVASTGSDLVSAVVAGVGALKGPLHGGAPGPVLDMLDAIGTPSNAKDWLLEELQSGRRIMGMGHRIYRVRDPRAAVLEQALVQLEAAGVETPRLALARAVETAATEILRERKPDRPLCANVEFYTAVLLDALGIDRRLFTATFAVGRIVGWCAHVMEQRQVGKLIRPDSDYVGVAI